MFRYIDSRRHLNIPALLTLMSLWVAPELSRAVEFEALSRIGNSSETLGISGSGTLLRIGDRDDREDLADREDREDHAHEILWNIKTVESSVSMVDQVDQRDVNIRTVSIEGGVGYSPGKYVEFGIGLNPSQTFGVNILGFGPSTYARFEIPVLDDSNQADESENAFHRSVNVLIFAVQKSYSVRSGSVSPDGERIQGFSWSESAAGIRAGVDAWKALSFEFGATFLSYDRDFSTILSSTGVEDREDAGGFHIAAEESPFEFAKSLLEVGFNFHWRRSEVGIVEKRVDLGIFAAQLWSTVFLIGTNLTEHSFLGAQFESAVGSGSAIAGLGAQAYGLQFRWSP